MFHHRVRRTADFHKKHKLHFGRGMHPDVLTMRTHLILEESAELMLAVFKEEEIKILDALGDIMYVCAGSYVAIVGESRAVDAPVYTEVNVPVHSDAYKGCARFGVTEILRGLHYQLIECYEMTLHAMIMTAQMGYDPVAVFDRIADSNDTKDYTGDQRVSNKGPNYKPPVLEDLCRKS